MLSNNNNKCRVVDMKATAFLEYKSAIALNNIGVTLLTRCRYNDALLSFQNGFMLMNSSLKENITRRFSSFDDCFNHDNNDGCVNDVSTNQSSTLPQEMLHQASIKLAQSATVKASTSHDDNLDLLHPIILTADKTSNSILDLMNLGTPCSNNYYAIRIDDDGVCDFDETVPISDYMLEIAIILNNIGTVYRCYANDKKSSISSSSRKSSSSASKKNKKLSKVLTSGLSFCTAARGILSTMADVGSTEDEIKRQGLLSLLILDNLMKLSYSIRDNDNARQYYIESGDLRSMLLTTLIADNEHDDESQRSSRHPTDKVVGSCFYVENEAFHITAAGAA